MYYFQIILSFLVSALGTFVVSIFLMGIYVRVAKVDPKGTPHILDLIAFFACILGGIVAGIKTYQHLISLI